ncbi:MAG: VacB/RNase II family 3'-5' exoribonuclease [Chlamydiales bacterium]|nr:VacB/RNase II family 3'-5' exoribonuclease [Chlamydiales bacterium]
MPRKRRKSDEPEIVTPPTETLESAEKPKKAASSKKGNSKQERLFQNLLKVTYEYIKGRHYSPQNKESLIERLKIHPEHLEIFDLVLKYLKKEGKVEVAAGEKLISQEESAKEKIVVGTIKMHPRGFGFVVIKNSSDPDVFIPKPYVNHAIDGDVVEVAINLEAVSERGPEGKVLSIISRKRKTLVGTVSDIGDAKAFVFASLLGEKRTVEVPNVDRTLKVGDRVLLDITKWGDKEEGAKGELAKILGHISDPTTDIPVAILENEIRTEFPQDAVLEALSYGTRVRKEDLEGREDLRNIECFTIDPDTAKDFDDAISLEREKGNWVLGVHIADVSHYVKDKSALDREASLRCNSTYFPAKCIPMLPSELSDNLCSLREGVLRLTVSVFITIDDNGDTKNYRITKSVIKSQKRFTYKQAKKVLDGEMESKHKPKLHQMVEVCYLLKKKRSERGSVQLFMPEFKIKVDEKGVPVGTEIIEYDITHQLVEEFMLKANETVAVALTKQGKNATFRVHEEPAKESLREFSALACAFGYNLPQDPTGQDIQAFFAEIDEGQTAQYLATSYIRSMRLACYSPDNIGHYGLSLEYYTHFTSPIRRYVDTIIHRLLFEGNIDREKLQEISNDASERERISARAEGSVTFLKKLRLLEACHIKERNRTYEAVVTRVKPFGISFDVLDFMLEGFLHVSELDEDFFDYSEKEMMLLGRYQGLSYKAGDKLSVSVRHIDFILQECSWQLITHTGDASVENRRRNMPPQKSTPNDARRAARKKSGKKESRRSSKSSKKRSGRRR